MSPERRIRILLADDHTLVRAGIRALVEDIAGTQVVAEAVDGREAVAFAKVHQPDLVIMDISMKELNGIEATIRVRDAAPQAKVLILSMHAAEEFVRRALGAGASGYIVKDSAPRELQMAIEAIMRGEVYLSSRVSRHVVAAFVKGSASQAAPSLDSLTARQREILQMIAEGKSTKEIAARLMVSVKTVESHRAALMQRLAIDDLAGLVVYAARNHLITIDVPDK